MRDLRTKPGHPGTEDSLQILCAAFLKKALFNAGEPQLFHHCPSGGNRNIREAAKFRLMGVIKGVPDVFLPLRSGDFCGIYCELKNGKGKLSTDQIHFMEDVAKEGYLALVVNDIETFKEVFTEYLNNRKQTK